jgi:hypothetical protein
MTFKNGQYRMAMTLDIDRRRALPMALGIVASRKLLCTAGESQRYRQGWVEKSTPPAPSAFCCLPPARRESRESHKIASFDALQH